MNNNVRLSTLTPCEARDYKRWMRRRRGEFTKREAVVEAIEAVAAMMMLVAFIAIFIRL